MESTLINLPGVQIKEVRLSGSPIAGVSTSIAGFVGQAPLNRFLYQAKVITSKEQFDALYILEDPINPVQPPLPIPKPDPLPDPERTMIEPDHPQIVTAVRSKPLSRAVQGFFENGGNFCYVVNVGEPEPAPASPRHNLITNIIDGLALLEVIDEISIIAAPGFPEDGIRIALKDQAVRTGDRVALLDPPSAVTVTDPADKTQLPRPVDSQYAAYYYPQVQVGKLLPSDPPSEFVTPVGHIAGVYARVDATRGVHKAPANESIRGVLGLEQLITDKQQNSMNDRSVNALRLFSGNVVIWGARTTSTDSIWRYVNIRRLVNYIEKSLQVGLRWAVFEPNKDTLRKQISRSVRDFLTGIWRDGALFGDTADQAFYVRFPEIFNTGAERALGKLTMEIGLRAAYPAEFIIIRIGLLIQDDNAA